MNAIESLFRAFVNGIVSTVNDRLAESYSNGRIVITEEEIQYWLKYLPFAAPFDLEDPLDYTTLRDFYISYHGLKQK